MTQATRERCERSRGHRRGGVVEAFAGGEIIAVAKGVEVARAEGKPAEAAGERGQFVEIEGEEENAVSSRS